MVPDLESGPRSFGSRLRSYGPRRPTRPLIFLSLAGLIGLAYYNVPYKHARHSHIPPHSAKHGVSPIQHVEPHTPPFIQDEADEFDQDLYFNDPLEFSNNDNIPPVNPNFRDLPDPALFFPEVDLDAPIESPRVTPFPEDHLPWIASTPIKDMPGFTPDEATEPHWPADSFAQDWVAPVGDEWKGTEGSRKVQFDFGNAPQETANEKQTREARRDAVKRGFIWAWQGYKRHAWGHDEVKPVSETPSNPFNNWGASIIDTLDTLLILGLPSEYTQARAHINQLNLHWISGHDYVNGFVAPREAPPSHDGSKYWTPSTPAKPWMQHRDRTVALPVFETGIRYLGGLLGAYELTADSLVLERAVELAEILGKAFLTPVGLPLGRIEPGSPHKLFGISRISLAEVGTMSLEMTRLSQVTGDRKWFDLAQRATDFLDKRVSGRSSMAPLIPTMFDPNSMDTMVGTYSFGGLADSYYEYLIKQYRLLGGDGPIAKQYKRLYGRSIDAAKRFLYVDVTVVPDRDLMTIGKHEYGQLVPECEHLTCFAGAMLGLGAKLLDRPGDMRDAERFTQTCYWLSAATHTGLQPESVTFFYNDDPYAWENVTIDGEPFISPKAPPLRNPIAWVKRQFAPPEDDGFDDSVEIVFRDRHGVLRDAETGAKWIAQEHEQHGHGHGHGHVNVNAVQEDEESLEEGHRDWEDEADFFERLRGTPVGTQSVSGRGLSRPETIESIYYMYRLTGDKKWQDKGWQMFTAWSKAAKVPGGFSSLEDVTLERPLHGDNLESFVFAETFKYHYLLQSEPSYMSLDTYVANTEAHWLIADSSLKPGSQGLWTPPRDREEGLGKRGEGTDAQKWVRFELLEMMQSRRVPITHLNHGSSGMGGGSGVGARPGSY